MMKRRVFLWLASILVGGLLSFLSFAAPWQSYIQVLRGQPAVSAAGLSISGYYITDGTNYYVGAPINLATLPVFGSFSWLTTQGTGTAAAQGGGITLTAPPTSGDAVRCFGQAISSASTLTVAYTFQAQVQNFVSGGISFYESASGKLETFWITDFANQDGSTPSAMTPVVARWNSATSFGSNVLTYAETGLFNGDFRWYRIQKTGGNLNFFYSTDGQNFIQLYTEAQNAFFTTAPDNWCIAANGNNGGGTTTARVTLYSWLQQ
jgi:hypothetical protein